MDVHSITAGTAGTDTVSGRFRDFDEPTRRSVAHMTRPTQPHPDSGRRYEGGQVVWRVQCGDLISRERSVTVFVENGEVVLVGPPGETARLSASQLGQLRAALNEAAELARK
ncbi:hypothetical protein [Saccharomonospora viridis]|uniref:hypothetical protein n=1 Tax=Saccharomonospora viridis TaxID=1852 RepID=UPI00240A65DF|nr:hypothetical protein [Saccharomonospora viridis]